MSATANQRDLKAALSKIKKGPLNLNASMGSSTGPKKKGSLLQPQTHRVEQLRRKWQDPNCSTTSQLSKSSMSKSTT